MLYPLFGSSRFVPRHSRSAVRNTWFGPFITAGAYFRITFGSTQARVRCAWFQCGQHRRLRRRAGKQACMKRGWMQLNNLNHNVLNEADTSSHHSLGLLSYGGKSPLLRHKQYILIKYATKPLSARVGRAKVKEHCIFLTLFAERYRRAVILMIWNGR